MTPRLTDPLGRAVHEAILFALDHGQEGDEQHKLWVIDQMLRTLAGDRYEALIAEFEQPADHGPDTFTEWDQGKAP